MKIFALSFLPVVLVGCSHASRDPIPWSRSSGWVCIGAYPDEEAEAAIATLLRVNQIPSEIGDGSVVYVVSVPCVYAKRASELLLANSKEKGYWYLPMEELARRMADQTMARLVLTDMDDDMAEGNYAKVTGTLETAIELIPTNPGLYGRCITAYILKGELGQARAILERAKQNVPAISWVWKEREVEVAEAEKANAR